MFRSKTPIARIVMLSLILLVAGAWLPGRGLLDAAAVAVAGGGIFVNSGQSLGGETGNGVALGDLDGDGDVDAFVANDFQTFGEANQVWFNDGNGFFTAGQTLGTYDGKAVALGDLDGDGDLDAIVVGVSNPTLRGAAEAVGAIQVWVNQGGAQAGGEGEFAAGDEFGFDSSFGVAVGDVDNDGDLDALVVGNSNQVWLNDGDAAFAAGPALPYQFSRAVLLADLDGDGWLDAVIADSQYGTNNRVWWNDGNWVPGPGSFTAGDPLPTANLMQGVAVGNLDGDNQPDIFLVGSGPDQFFWNEGARTFSTAGPLPVSDNSWAVALADVDGDGLPDAVVGNHTGDANRLWHNDGGRTFTVAQEFGAESNLSARRVALADLNGDGPADLFEVTGGQDRVWFNTSGPPPPIIPNEEGWQIQTVDARGDTGFLASMALDANGYPHIAYLSYASQSFSFINKLHFARWDGVRWHRETVATNIDLAQPSFVLDGNGYPHILYRISGLLRYARWNGSQWLDEALPLVGAGNFSLALDSGGNPHISYVVYSDGYYLRYAYWDGAIWQVETIEDVYIINHDATSLALDAGDNPHVVYVDDASPQLRYAHKEGGVWQSETVDDGFPIFSRPASELVLDAQGLPHIGYFREVDLVGQQVIHAYRYAGNWTFQVADQPPLEVRRVSLDLDSSGNPHLFYVLESFPEGTFFKYWNGTKGQAEYLDYSDSVGEEWRIPAGVAVALDGEDRLHAAYYHPAFIDLRYVTWAPNWQLRSVGETGALRSPVIELVEETPAIAFYNETSEQLKLALWDDGWMLDPLASVANPVTDLSLAVGPTGAGHLSYYDADNQRLLYGYWNGATWNMEVVDEAGDVGRYNDLVLLPNSDSPRIAYWDASSLRVRLAIRDPNFSFWTISPDLAGPPLNAESGPLSAAVLPGGDVGVAYYDGANGDLRLARWDAETTTWTDELVAGASSDAGRLNALQTDGTEGAPVLAYFEQGEIRMAYKVGELWNYETAVPGLADNSVTGLSLELGLNSRRHARIAFTTAAGRLYVASRRDGAWQIEAVADDAGSAAGEVSAARDSRLRLAYTDSAQGLLHAFRTATLRNETVGIPFFLDGSYNPLDACAAILWDFIHPPGYLNQNRSRLVVDAPLLQLVAPLAHDEPLGDLAIFGGMTSLFSATPDGLQYIDLYLEHGSEMGRLGLEDLGLLWDAWGALQNFLPGLEALVTGRGDEVVVTQEMVDDALDIWQRLAAAGSPALAATINAELAQTNNLQDFVGLSFDEWALAIGVNPPAKTVYLPLVVRP